MTAEDDGDLRLVADELYGLDPGGFTSTRDAGRPRPEREATDLWPPRSKG